MKSLHQFIQESSGILARCSSNIGPDDLKDLNSLLKDLELEDVITVSYGGGGILLTVLDENAPDSDYAAGYLKALKDAAPKSWRIGKIEKLM